MKKPSKKSKQKDKEAKRVNVYSSIINSIKDTHSPYHVEDYSKQQLYPFIKELKQQKVIRKINQENWIIIDEKRVNKIGSTTPPEAKRVNKTIDGHAFQIKFVIPSIKDWDKRHLFLDHKGVEYNINSRNHGVYFDFKNSVTDKFHNVVLYNDSIDIRWPEDASIFGLNALQARGEALEQSLIIMGDLEQFLKLSPPGFRINGHFRFRFTHNGEYADIDSDLAKYINSKGINNFRIYGRDGLWWVCDISKGILHGEATNSKTSVPDSVGMQDWGNDLRDRGFTKTGDIIDVNYETSLLVKSIAQKLDFYAENEVTHIKLKQGIDLAALKLAEVAEKLSNNIPVKRLHSHHPHRFREDSK
jgi:hypothetical protein